MKGVALLCLWLAPFFLSKAQTNISGTVTDKIGPIEGAFVYIQQTNQAVVTDALGKFELTISGTKNITLEVRFVGYIRHTEILDIRSGKTSDLRFVLEPDILGLNEVVVSANRYETSRKEAPVSVSIIGQKLFNATQSQTLADGLNFKSGIRVETNCQNCGFTQVRLNGLEGPYTQILLNSRPLFSSLIGVYGLEMIPTYMIDRVEVVKSGGSALFGSNAIAGTVNVITKEPVLNTWELRSNYASIGGRANDWNNSLNGSYVSNDLNFGLTGFLTHKSRQAYDANNDGFTEMVELQSKTFGLKSFFKPSSQAKLIAGFNYIDEYRRGGNELHLSPEFTDITEQLNHEIRMGSIEYERYLGDQKLSVYTSYQNTNRASYYGGLGGGRTSADSLLAANAYGQTEDQSFVGGIQWINLSNASHTFTTGLEYQRNRTEDAISGYARIVDQAVNNLGLYSQWEWVVSENLKFLTGLRFDQSKVDGLYQVGNFNRTIENDFGVFSPRFTLLYDLNPKMQFRGGYARGFRAPQAFNEDLHIASAGGEPVFVLLSDNLQKETSDALTGELSYDISQGAGQFELSFQGFYTRLNNPFVLVNTGSQLPNGSIIEEVRNGDGAIVQGFNLEVNYGTSTGWTFQSGFTLQKADFTTPQVLFEPESGSEGETIIRSQFMRMPNTYGFWNLTYDAGNDWKIFLSNVITGSMLVPEILQENGNLVLRKSPMFWDSTLNGSYHFHIGENLHFELSAGVQNIFNSFQNDFQTGPTRDSDYIYGPARPRTYFFSLKVSNND